MPLTTASDAHTLPDVAERTTTCGRLLAAAGVDTLRGFRNRAPHDGPGPADAGELRPADPGPGA